MIRRACKMLNVTGMIIAVMIKYTKNRSYIDDNTEYDTCVRVCACACVFRWVNGPKYYYISIHKYQATGIILNTKKKKKHPKRNNEPREENKKYNLYITTVQHSTITRGMNNEKKHTRREIHSKKQPRSCTSYRFLCAILCM